ncbi:hypothetical protein [Klebsiella oxytoca]|uniref:hypothetical protein n=1 Tax=Klebsiella oxytoca TaxID=571 RepID=UPI003981D1F4
MPIPHLSTSTAGGALRLSGLPARRLLLTCSPAKRSATGKKPRRSLTSAHPPQAARCACPGYRPADCC